MLDAATISRKRLDAEPVGGRRGAAAGRVGDLGPVSPLEGEMSPKATEGVAARGAPALIRRRR
ncbi:hypothetical protein EN781_33280 [Mesorhizobium sp. M4A.F.Ca.ET.090.04.2.1]|nr:hypothetical protein EN781_33280 [Mesorhizobium sp. M4A.F.Ca.ET.090.04.2.1]